MKRRIAVTRITVRGHTIRFNMEATRWLRVYHNTGVQFWADKNLPLEKARKVEVSVRHLTAMRALGPELVRRILVAAAQAVALYRAEIWWNSLNGWCE